LAVELEITSSQTIEIKNPWPGEAIRVVDSMSHAIVPQSSKDAVIRFQARAGKTYLVERETDTPGRKFSPVEGKPATAARKLGKVMIGLESR
jgi:hypothetical protein